MGFLYFPIYGYGAPLDCWAAGGRLLFYQCARMIAQGGKLLWPYRFKRET